MYIYIDVGRQLHLKLRLYTKRVLSGSFNVIILNIGIYLIQIYLAVNFQLKEWLLENVSQKDTRRIIRLEFF